jgi:hypothetical protein
LNRVRINSDSFSLVHLILFVIVVAVLNEDFFGAEPSGVYWLLVSRRLVMILNVNNLEQRWFWFLLVWSHNQVDGFRGECFVGGVEGGGGGGGEGRGGR